MQKNNPSGFYSFTSKILLLILLGTAVYWLIGIVFVLPIMILGFAGCWIWMRIEGRHTWELWNERYKVMRQISELDKKLRTESGDPVPIYREIKRLEEVEKSLAEQIRTVEKQVEEEKARKKAKKYGDIE